MVALRGYMYGMAGISGQLVCGRQFMNSLEDSSLEECKRAIAEEPFLAAYYEVGDKYIKSHDGRVWFTFVGLDRNIGSIKSKGRILLLWVDEAEPVTDAAWQVVIPTLREEGDGWNAELWVTWNPERKASATNKRFRNSQDPRVKVAEINWRDNPWFPAVLNRTRLKDKEERPDTYDHIWEGAFGSSFGAILSKWVSKAERDGRVHDDVTFDPRGPGIIVSSDLGFRDTASWWYWQQVPGGFNLLKYQGESGMDAEDWMPEIAKNINELGGKLGKIWLPHDAKVKTFQSKHSTIEKFLTVFPGKVGVVPQSRKADQINAARTVIDRCAFNRELCEEGLDGLSAWEFGWDENLEVFTREPIHNWASHPSDAFAYGCQVLKEHEIELPETPARFPVMGVPGGRITTATLDELYATTPSRSKRI